jgi:hypothetical protein
MLMGCRLPPWSELIQVGLKLGLAPAPETP